MKERLKKNINKKESAITLIALVVTIVVLLILAGVSISMLSGENGIVIQAQKAKENTRGGAVKEAKDIWKSNNKLDELNNSSTSQSLTELLNELINNNLLTEDERDQIIGNKEKNVTATGEITIGDINTDFRQLELYPSIRVGRFTEGTTEQEIGLVCQLVKLSEDMLKNEYNSYFHMPISGKENFLFETMNVFAKKFMGKEFSSAKELLNELFSPDINSFKDMYDMLIQTEGAEYMEYDEFLNASVQEMPIEQRVLMLEFIVTKPDGTTYTYKTENSDENELTMPITDYGTYKITVKSLTGEYVGTTEIEYTNSKYLMTYDGNYNCELYDVELKQVVPVDEAYVYYKGKTTDVHSKIFDNYIELSDLNDSKVPFYLEFVKGTQKISIPIVITKDPM